VAGRVRRYEDLPPEVQEWMDAPPAEGPPEGEAEATDEVDTGQESAGEEEGK